MSCIDAHVHVWTDDYATYPFAAGHDPAAAKPRTFVAADILGQARPCGVERIVLVQMSYYGADNRYMLRTLEEYPEVFAGIGIVDAAAARPDQAMAELAGRGVRGFRISPGRTPVAAWLDGEGYERMFAAAARGNLALCPLIGPDALPALDRRCRQFPEAPVIIDHLCRIGVTGTVAPAEVQALCQMAQHPRVLVKVSAFYALGRKTPPYEDLAALIEPVYRAFGAARLMWASDAPYQVQEPHTYGASVALVRDRLPFLSPADREQILGGTAAGFFFGD